MIGIEGKNFRAVNRTVRKFERGFESAALTAVNRSAKSGQAHGAKLIGQELNLKASRIKKAVMAGGKLRATKRYPSAAILTASRPAPRGGQFLDTGGPAPAGALNLKNYNPRKLKRGVSAKVYRTRPPVKLSQGFMPDKFGGAVFKRRGRARFPIDPIYGPGIASVFKRKMQAIRNHAQKRVDIEYKRAIRNVARRSGAVI